MKVVACIIPLLECTIVAAFLSQHPVSPSFSGKFSSTSLFITDPWAAAGAPQAQPQPGQTTNPWAQTSSQTPQQEVTSSNPWGVQPEQHTTSNPWAQQPEQQATSPSQTPVTGAASLHRSPSSSTGSSMIPMFDALFDRVSNMLGLQATDYTETLGASTWSCPTSGVTGTALWLSEANPKFLTGVTKSTRVGGDNGSEDLTLNIWMGPSYDTPNMLLSFGSEGNGKYSVTADYVVRGATPVGSDPQYLEAYYDADVMNSWTKAYSLTGATPLAPKSSFYGRILDSPARIALGNLEKSDAEAIAAAHVDRFLGWLDGAQPVMARLRGSFNLRDDKLRQYYYRGLMIDTTSKFGESLGATVAAVETGPLAEAYVGGGS